MKKYIIIAALSLCNNTWAMKHTAKEVDALQIICTQSGWLPKKDLSLYPKKSYQWDSAVTNMIIEHEKTRMNNKKFNLAAFLSLNIPRRAKL
jgi:hypothetical protein